MSYKTEKVITDAQFPRLPGGALPSGTKLKLVYNRFTNNSQPDKNKIQINLVFSHGTGMNKEVWSYYVRTLFAANDNYKLWQLNTIIARDAVNHGDSAILNGDRLGFDYPWDQGGKDIVAVIKNEISQGTIQVNDKSKIILIGHSLGGSESIFAGFYAPTLIDSVISIEPVTYGDEASMKKFGKILGKMRNLIIDKFDSEDDFDTYYKEFSFYKVFTPEILKDFVSSEKVDNKDGTFSSKASAYSQLATYFGAMKSVPLLMSLLPHYRIPLCHVVGSEATWSPPEVVPYTKECVSESLLEQHSIEGGDHLVNGQKPDECIALIKKYVTGRVDKVDTEINAKLENRFAGNRNDMFETFINDSLKEIASEGNPKL